MASIVEGDRAFRTRDVVFGAVVGGSAAVVLTLSLQSLGGDADAAEWTDGKSMCEVYPLEEACVSPR